MSDHLDGGLLARQERRVSRHLVHCRRCRLAYESLRRTVAQLRAFGRNDLAASAPSVADAVVDRVRHERR